jgi:hypothetical protein
MLIKNLEWEKKICVVWRKLNWKKLARLKSKKAKHGLQQNKTRYLILCQHNSPKDDARRSINWVFKKALWPVPTKLACHRVSLITQFIPDYYIWCIFACLYININTLTQHLHKNNLLAPMFNWNQIAPTLKYNNYNFWPTDGCLLTTSVRIIHKKNLRKNESSFACFGQCHFFVLNIFVIKTLDRVLGSFSPLPFFTFLIEQVS